ncbi:MAG TPA: type II toxin-antitoxin system VapC family toxin [Acidimicrobiales bacterium]|nr:type II toxin-antitoxin system VapC family toxin [Acidimicrobiales bacterium]
MKTFADSSALVKLYADEPGHEVVRALDVVAVAQLARVEVPAALWRKCRVGELSVEDAGLLSTEFEADYIGTAGSAPRFHAVVATAAVLGEAAKACAVHGLRAYDAVQLCCALAVRRQDPTCDAVAAFDQNLRRAAAAEGFALVPPALEPGAQPNPRPGPGSDVAGGPAARD